MESGLKNALDSYNIKLILANSAQQDKSTATQLLVGSRTYHIDYDSTRMNVSVTRAEKRCYTAFVDFFRRGFTSGESAFRTNASQLKSELQSYLIADKAACSLSNDFGDTLKLKKVNGPSYTNPSEYTIYPSKDSAGDLVCNIPGYGTFNASALSQREELSCIYSDLQIAENAADGLVNEFKDTLGLKKVGGPSDKKPSEYTVSPRKDLTGAIDCNIPGYGTLTFDSSNELSDLRSLLAAEQAVNTLVDEFKSTLGLTKVKDYPISDVPEDAIWSRKDHPGEIGISIPGIAKYRVPINELEHLRDILNSQAEAKQLWPKLLKHNMEKEFDKDIHASLDTSKFKDIFSVKNTQIHPELCANKISLDNNIYYAATYPKHNQMDAYLTFLMDGHANNPAPSHAVVLMDSKSIETRSDVPDYFSPNGYKTGSGKTQTLSEEVAIIHLGPNKKIEVKEYSLTIEKNGDKKTIPVFHVTNWADRTALSNDDLTDLQEHIRTKYPENHSRPLVHCHAGVGRTAQYISIDYMSQLSEDSLQKTSVEDIVFNMRAQRNPSMIQTEPQLRALALYACGKLAVQSKRDSNEPVADSENNRIQTTANLVSTTSRNAVFKNSLPGLLVKQTAH
ncbi:protein-tyrosine phosphatase family protein [Enterobacter mori]|uniref:protein-tyrosine phosphatase family protein n=1 Tax=Enterobacter mori TaxID=539813 RepID=UPI0020160240|nr:protein-tyrosine phosphatase family protein [Enterobacter mori]